MLQSVDTELTPDTPSTPDVPLPTPDLPLPMPTPDLPMPTPTPMPMPMPTPMPDQFQHQNSKWQQMREKYSQRMQDKESQAVTLDSNQSQQMQRYTDYRNKQISAIMGKSAQFQIQAPMGHQFQSFLEVEKREIQSQDQPSLFFDDDQWTKNINAIPAMGNTTYVPWSGSYWPMKNGAISVRYNKNDKNTIGQLDESGQYISFFNWATSVSRYAQPSEHLSLYSTPDFSKYVDENYSASEKYDLLVGDYNYTLTNFLKNEGAEHQMADGDVISWFGLCHGWAVAAVYFPRPSQSVMMTATNGMSVRFLPDDIKGLASLFWGNADFTSKFVGNRCEYYYPHPGWFTSANCISINPAAFMIILGNQAGLRGKNLVFDPNADPEIWNEPLKSYEFKFYNPISGEFFGNSASAKVPLSQLRGANDEYLQYVASYADPKTVHAVGVFMRITHGKMLDNTNLKHDDTTEDDDVTTEEFDSIVELDASDNLMGGEWKYKTHPNFLWWYDEAKPVEGVSDKEVPFYAGDYNYLASITDLITTASAKGQPLRAIVDYLTASSA